MKEINLAIELIRHYEGFREYAYRDTEGIWTIGTGFTYWDGREVTESYPGRVTVEQDTQQLARWVTNASQHLFQSIPNVWLLLTANQRAALISFNYNTGWVCGDAGFDSLNKCIKEGKLFNVPIMFKKYTNGGLLGLVRRRRAEGLVWYGQSVKQATTNAERENQ